MHVQAAVINLVLAEAVDELPAHFLQVKRGHFPGGIGHALEYQRFGHGRIVLGLGDPALDEHAAEHVFLAVLSRLEIAERTVAGGRLGQTGQQGRLGNAELAHMDAEIGSGRGFHAVSPGAEVDLVQVNREDFVLGQVLFQAIGQDASRILRL